MPSRTKPSPKPAHSQAAEQSDQISFIYGSQYDQYPRGNQYQSHGGASYSGNQYQPQNNAQDQAIKSGFQYTNKMVYWVLNKNYKDNFRMILHPGLNKRLTKKPTQHSVVPNARNAAPPNKDYMIPAVLSCVFCYWPTGLCAITAACKANMAAENGDVIEARRQSRKARIYATAAVIAGICLIIWGVVIYVVICVHLDPAYKTNSLWC
eukprot:XP_019918708.1 PREDICTED: uncharacterized protein LOC105318290 isoform X1 [Crassostrea gigas]